MADDEQQVHTKDSEATAVVDGAVESGQELPALQAIVERQITRVDNIRVEIKRLSESMRSILENDNEYSIQAEQVKEVSKKAKERRSSLTQSPEYRQLLTSSSELKDELKELEESLNTHLLNYYEKTGVKVVDTAGGRQREFKILAKLLPNKKPATEDEE